MHIETAGLIVARRQHGEHGAIIRLLTPEHGLQACYVRGGRGGRLRPVLLAGNSVHARLTSRTDAQLAQGVVELVHSRGALMAEPLPAAAIDWACTLTAVSLPEAHSYPRLYDALDGLLGAIDAAPAASGWGAALVRYELLLLAELGFGLDLSACAVSGRTENLVAVSPRSGRAVSAEAALPYAASLLPLPPFLGGTSKAAGWSDILDGLDLTGHFLARDILVDRARNASGSRSRLIQRLRRASGIA